MRLNLYQSGTMSYLLLASLGVTALKLTGLDYNDNNLAQMESTIENSNTDIDASYIDENLHLLAQTYTLNQLL